MPPPIDLSFLGDPVRLLSGHCRVEWLLQLHDSSQDSGIPECVLLPLISSVPW